MTDPRFTGGPAALDRVYGEGYFHGSGSGYSAEGYEHDHADWTPWLAWTQPRIGPAPRWLDLGCAYGHLIAQAVERGVEAYGADISSYALRRHPPARGRLIRSLAAPLPFLDSRFGVVSAFDLFEHLDDPEPALREIGRVLKPGGFLLLTTPDPLHFHRPEPTHIHERPPSYWIDLLRRHGWRVALRFGRLPYELEILACREPESGWEAACREFQSQSSAANARFHISGEDLYGAVRSPWDGPDLNEEAVVYLLNASRRPARLSVALRSRQSSHPDLFLGDLKLRYLGLEESGGDFIHRWNPLTIPPAGQDLRILAGPEPLVEPRFELTAGPVENESFLLELPFDHYQRYQAVAAVLNQQVETGHSVLDVGGALGYLDLFAPGQAVTVLDRVWEDRPHALRYDGGRLPFADRSFDIVTAVDTLEHVPPDQRPGFLSELARAARQAVILCGPYDEPHVAEAESLLRDYLRAQLGHQDRFLEEHARYTLPRRAAVAASLQELGFELAEIPNGYLPRWLLMQCVTFALGLAPELDEGKRRLNAVYNRHFYEPDNQYPAYRILTAAFRGRAPESPKPAAASIRLEHASTNPWNLAGLIASLSTLSLLREQQGYMAEHEQHVARLLVHLRNLEDQLRQEAGQRESQQKHARNLDTLVKDQAGQIRSLQTHADNLIRLIEEQQKERDYLEDRFQELQSHNTGLLEHIGNLERLNEEWKKHARNLEQMLQQKEGLLREKEQILRQAEDVLREKEAQLMGKAAALAVTEETLQQKTHRLEGMEQHLRNLEQHIKNLEALNESHTQALTAVNARVDRLSRSFLYRVLKKLRLLPPL
ncbi:MAG: methyltransferase domain-containing protein [bacterium]